jgi:hypothetical protein
MSGGRALRVCSLLRSATEIVAAVGQLDRLVGRSAECDFPPYVSLLPIVTSARIYTENLTSAAVDAAVRDALADGRSLYAVDADLIARLAPDLILTQDLCEVCAVSSSDGALCALGIETLTLDAHSLGDIVPSILLLVTRLGVPARGRRVAEAIEAKVALTRARVRGLPRRRVFVSEWLDPPFAAASGCRRWLTPPAAHDHSVAIARAHELQSPRDVLGRRGMPELLQQCREPRRIPCRAVANRQPHSALPAAAPGAALTSGVVRRSATPTRSPTRPADSALAR